MGQSVKGHQRTLHTFITLIFVSVLATVPLLGVTVAVLYAEHANVSLNNYTICNAFETRIIAGHVIVRSHVQQVLRA